MMQERNVHNDTRAISNDYQMKVQFIRVLEQAALKIVSQMNHKWSTSRHLIFLFISFQMNQKWTSLNENFSQAKMNQKTTTEVFTSD